jgi:ankyrin repeat protein
MSPITFAKFAAAMSGTLKEGDITPDFLKAKTDQYMKLDDGDMKDDQGMTALMLAAKYGQPNSIRYLLGHDPELSHAQRAAVSGTYSGKNALMYALSRGHVECVPLLVEGSRNDHLEYSDAYGFTPLMYAITSCNESVTYIVEELRKRWILKEQLSHKDKTGYTVLMHAIARAPIIVPYVLRELRCAKLLEEQLIDIKSAVTPLMVACMYGRYECIPMLLEAGLEKEQLACHTREHYKDTALVIAAINNHPKCVLTLLDYDISSQNLDLAFLHVCNMLREVEAGVWKVKTSNGSVFESPDDCILCIKRLLALDAKIDSSLARLDIYTDTYEFAMRALWPILHDIV